MAGFSHDVAGGGGNLVVASLQSPDFKTGVQGWQLTKGGNFEANNAVIRGSEVIGGTQLDYDGTPAQGNLIYSRAETAGVDSENNAYLAGTTTYNVTGSPPYSAVGINNGAVSFYAAVHPYGPWNMLCTITGTGETGPSGPVWSVAAFSAGISIAGKGAWYAPSGDATGATDSSVIAGFLASGVALHLVPGTYYLDTPLSIPAGGSVVGAGRSTILTPGSAWSGSMVVEMAGNTFSEVGHLQISAGGLADGIDLVGAVNPWLHDIDIESPVNGVAGSSSPETVRAERVTVHQATGIGFAPGATDSTWNDCLALGCASEGWFIGSGNANSKFIACRAEFSGSYGWQVSGAWNTGTGSGGPHFIGCSTDRNAKSGVFISATGTTPIMFTNLACRRDGSSSLTQYAGFEVSAATIPVIVAGLQVFTGVDDNGGGNLSPWSAVNISGSPTFISLADALLHGATQGLNGSAPYGMASYRNLATRTGSTSAPSAISLVMDSA